MKPLYQYGRAITLPDNAHQTRRERMIRAIIAILAGLLLMGDFFDNGTTRRFVDRLRPFDASIGVTAIIFGVLNIFSLLGVLLLLGGLVLGARALASVPNVGDDLVRAGNAVGHFRTLIGFVLLILGVLAVIGRIV